MLFVAMKLFVVMKAIRYSLGELNNESNNIKCKKACDNNALNFYVYNLFSILKSQKEE